MVIFAEYNLMYLIEIIKIFWILIINILSIIIVYNSIIEVLDSY